MKTITIELNDIGGFEFKGVENLQSRSEFIQLMLAVRMLETRALEKGYLPELLEGLEVENKDKVRLLTKKEQEELGIGKQVSPTYIQIELPNNVPSKVKPIVILPTVDCDGVTIKLIQHNQTNFSNTKFEATLDRSTLHVINLNTGAE